MNCSFGCFDRRYKIMQRCLEKDPASRPSFKQIREELLALEEFTAHDDVTWTVNDMNVSTAAGTADGYEPF